MHLIDHHEPIWRAISDDFGTGGARTYSIDLVNHQVPLWKEVLDENALISTCPLLHNARITGNYSTVIQYLHTYKYANPVGKIMAAIKAFKFTYKKLILITAYKAFRDDLRKMGLNATYVPMSIDVPYIQQFQQPKADNKRFVYFGNVTGQKVRPYEQLKKYMRNHGHILDTLSFCKFNNGDKLPREEILRKLSTYNYGVGVGRAAQEMMALNVKPIIYGAKMGGIMVTQSDYNRQIATNLNGRIFTYSHNLANCIKKIDDSVIYAEDITTMDHPAYVMNDYSLE